MTDNQDTTVEPGLAQVADRAELARLLTARRERCGRTVREVARLAGLPLGTVGGYLSGRHLPQAATMDQFTRLLAALDVPADEVDEWVRAVARLRRVPGPRPADAPAPYRGLAAYDVADAPMFVGRERATRELVARVGAGPLTPLVVVGASGAGKSSLLRAGLAAHVRSSGGVAVVTTPGGDPAAALDLALAELAAVPGTPRVLVVDQCEEILLTQPAGEARPGFEAPPDAVVPRRSPLSDLVDRLATLHAEGTTVVLGLRADTFERALAHEVLAGWLASGTVLVGPMAADDLRRVVTEPARRVGLEVDDALVDALVAEATAGSPGTGATGRRTDPGVLPLVSHALYATWTTTNGRRLTLERYRAVGGLGGAIAQTAESVVAGLSGEQLEIARRVLLALVVLRDRAVTRRALDLADLAGDDVATVVAALVDARLLVVDRGQVQLAHEALLVAWPRLAAWIEADREALRVRSRLAEATRHWDESGRDDDLLYRGSQLESAAPWRADRRTLTAREQEFLDASLAAWDRRTQGRRRSARRLRGLAAGLAVLALSTGGLAVVGLTQSRAAAHERDLAVSRQLAVTAQTLTDTDPGLAAQVAAAAAVSADTVEARSALLSVSAIGLPTRLGRVEGIVNRLAVSPDGAVLAAATDHSSLTLWALGDRPHLLAEVTVDDAALYALTFTADGSTLLAGGDSGGLRAWAVDDPASPRALPVHDEAVGGTLYGLAADAAGTLVAGAVSDGSVRLWRRAGGALEPGGTVPAFPGGSAQAVVLHGTLLAAAGSQGGLRLWDVADPGAPTALGDGLDLGEAQVNALALSPDGHTLAAGTTEGVVHLVDVSDPAAPAPGVDLTGPASWVNDLDFSPDGTRLAGASSDNHLWVWSLDTGAAAAHLANPTTLLAGRWSPDGRTLFSAGADGVLREWAHPGSILAGFSSIPGQGAWGDGLVATSTTDGLHLWDTTDPDHSRPIGTAPAPEGARMDGAVDVSDTLHLAVAGDTTGAIHVWDIADPRTPRYLGAARAHTDWVETVTFARDGTHLAVSSDDGSLTLWDLSAGLPDEPTGRVGDLGGAVYVVGYSPDGASLVASVLTGFLRLIDVSDPADPRLVGEPITGPEGYVYSAAFSPDGHTVAATGNDGTVWLWDVADPGAPAALGAPLRWAEGYGTNSTFSPDGSRLAVGMTDGTVRVWDVTDPAHPLRWAALSGAGGTVYGVEFSPDGSHLTAASADRTVRVWDVTSTRALALACSVATRGLAMTDDEWDRVAGDVPRPSPCG